MVRVMVNGVEKGRGKSIKIIQDKQEDYVQLRLISPSAKQRSYEGDFDIEIRKEAKIKKDFATSDKIRNQLTEMGINLKDEKGGEMTWSL